MENNFKSIPKLGAKVWQPLLDGKAITFGSPAPTAHREPKSVSSNSSMEDTQNQSKSSADKALSQEAIAAKIAQLRQQLQLTKETLEDVQDRHGSEIWLYQGELESLKDKSKIRMVVKELQAK